MLLDIKRWNGSVTEQVKMTLEIGQGQTLLAKVLLEISFNSGFIILSGGNIQSLHHQPSAAIGVIVGGELVP